MCFLVSATAKIHVNIKGRPEKILLQLHCSKLFKDFGKFEYQVLHHTLILRDYRSPLCI